MKFETKHCRACGGDFSHNANDWQRHHDEMYHLPNIGPGAVVETPFGYGVVVLRNYVGPRHWRLLVQCGDIRNWYEVTDLKLAQLASLASLAHEPTRAELEDMHAPDPIPMTNAEKAAYEILHCFEPSPEVQRLWNAPDAPFWILGMRDRAQRVLKIIEKHTHAPIPMILFCPSCHAQHIDGPEPATGWTNPPHRKHLCGACGAIFEPAKVNTVGVESLEETR